MTHLEAKALEIAERLSAAIEAGANPVVLVDGYSGSGKTSFTRSLADEIFRSTRLKPQIVHMDDLYPGWEGLRLGSNYLVNEILLPRSRGKTAEYQVWNWARGHRGITGDPSNGWRSVRHDSPLIVEGCGSVSLASKPLAHLAIWIESSMAVREQRLEERDKKIFASYKESWRIQENEFFKEESTKDLCEIFLDN